MDILSMLTNAQVTDLNGLELGRILIVHISSGMLTLTMDIEAYEEDGGPDDGAKDDIPEDDASKKFPTVVALNTKNGSDNG